MNRALAAFVILMIHNVLMANNPSINYISQYKQIAVSEMQRTGIPASIKMAQALLESGAGRSTLAREANNHFGIKCGGVWEGDTFYREDDDYKNGKLIKSCFRKFDSAMESFMAHSEFLVKQNRYRFLFDYKTTDYKAWAKGLRTAGYATDKTYANKLIDIIEKYELYELDSGHTVFEDEPILADTGIEEGEADSSNDVAAVNTKTTEASHTNATSSQRRYRVNKNAKHHTVREGETLAEIAYLYGLDESSLRLRNRLPKDAEPLRGEKLNLKKKIRLLKRPEFTRFSDGTMASSDPNFIF
ncbi:MAG: glucosaminidase domain-containing protein [Saprospiraceae bacterium]